MSQFCIDSLEFFPLTTFSDAGPIGILRFFASIVSIVVSIVCIFWIKRNQISAQNAVNESWAVKSVIFPVFVQILWFTAASYIYYSFLIIFITFPVQMENSIKSSVAYAVMSALQHGVTEGIAILLMQKGCGKYAALTAFKYTFMWTICTFFTLFVVFWKGNSWTNILSVGWDFLILAFYLTLWLAPQKHLFRRPAAILYAKFWAIFRLSSICLNLFLFFPASIAAYATCGSLVVWFILFPCLQPIVCYWTLLQDSRWWQGNVDSFLINNHLSSCF